MLLEIICHVFVTLLEFNATEEEQDRTRPEGQLEQLYSVCFTKMIVLDLKQ